MRLLRPIIFFSMALFVCSFLRSEYLCQSTHILSAKKLPKLSLKDFVHDLAFSKDGSMLSAAGAGGKISVWSTESWNVLFETNNGSDVIDVEFSHSGKFLFSASVKNGKSMLSVWDVQAENQISTYTESDPTKALITSLAVSPDDKTLIVGLDIGVVKLLDLRNIKEIKVLNPSFLTLDSGISASSFSPDGSMIVIGTGKGVSGPKDFGTFYVLNSQNGRELHRDSTLSGIFDVDFSSDGKVLAVAGIKNQRGIGRLVLKLLNTKKWTSKIFESHPVGEGLTFSADGKQLISAFPNSINSNIAVFDVERRHIKKTYSTGRPITALAYSSSSIVAAGSDDGSISLYRN